MIEGITATYIPGSSVAASLVISAKRFDAANMDELSLENEVFPVEGELVNYTTQFNPAQISIPRQVLLDALPVSGGN